MTPKDQLIKKIRKERLIIPGGGLETQAVNRKIKRICSTINTFLKDYELVKKGDLKKTIEEACGNSYDVGHAHARMDKKFKDKGWGEHSDKAIKSLGGSNAK